MIGLPKAAPQKIQEKEKLYDGTSVDLLDADIPLLSNL